MQRRERGIRPVGQNVQPRNRAAYTRECLATRVPRRPNSMWSRPSPICSCYAACQRTSARTRGGSSSPKPWRAGLARSAQIAYIERGRALSVILAISSERGN